MKNVIITIKMAQDIFISYSRQDKTLVHPFVEQISKAVGRDCWIDLKGIESGEEFEDVIIQAIDKCHVVLFMLSDNSLMSPWTKREVYYAEGEGKRIVPILVDGDKLRGWFKFHFGNVDYINIRSEEHKEKLIRNLRSWLGEDGNPEVETTPMNSMYSLTLISAGATKLQVVQNVKELFGLGLKEAKDLVDAAPSELSGVFVFEEAHRIKSILERNGAKVKMQSIKINNFSKYYVEIISVKSSDIKVRDLITNLTSFTKEEVTEYMAHTPCVLPFLSDPFVAADLKGKAEKEGAKIRLIPYTQNNQNIEFKMLSAGAAKLQVVKLVKERLNIGLKDAKDLVDSAPCVIATTQNFEDALWFVKELRDCGAIISIVIK